MRNLYIIFLGLSLLIISGCENQLDIVNPNQPTAEIFYRNADDAVKSVNSVYSRLGTAPISRFMPWLSFLRSDLMKSESPNNNIINNYDRFIINNYNFGNFSGIWGDLYVIIYRANQVLDNVPSIDMDEELKARLLGEAKFLRGWAYYYLGMYWGNVPIMLQTSKPTDRPETRTQQEVWDQAILDFQDASEALWTKGEYPANDLGRATKGAAHAMLGKTLMMQGNYPLALEAFDWLVTGAGASDYDLTEVYRDNFLSTTENNIESVFEFQHAENPLETHGNDVNPNADQLNYGSSLAPFIAPQPVGFSDLEMNRWVLNEFDEQTATGERDPRVEASFLFDSTDVRGPDFTMVYGQTWSGRYPAGHKIRNDAYLRKNLNDATQNTEDFSSPNNYRNIRYADVLLLYAECLNEVGRTNDAYPYVDAVRERATLEPLEDAHPEIGSDKTLFLEQLKHERITELAGEGHRWADLVRWGDLGSDLATRDSGFNNFVVGKHELLPIPQQDIDFNPNLDQNPEW